MARFSVSGIGDMMQSLTAAGRISDEDSWRVVSAGAKVLEQRYVEKLTTLFRVITGSLAASVKIQRKSPTTAILTPSGSHPGSSTGKRRPRTGGKSHGSYQGTNEEVAFILEYGSSRIAARHWMETTNEESGDEVTAAMAEEWNKLLTEKGL